MKKTTMLLLLALVLLSAFSLAAVAASDTEASTTIIWSNEESGESEPPPPTLPASPSGTWEINIPSTLVLRDGSGEIDFTANYMNIPVNEFLVVTIAAPPTSLINTYIELKNSNSDIVRVQPRVGGSTVYPGMVVARFTNGITTPIQFGSMALSVHQEDAANAAVGTYTGTIHFNIGIETFDDGF